MSLHPETSHSLIDSLRVLHGAGECFELRAFGGRRGKSASVLVVLDETVALDGPIDKFVERWNNAGYNLFHTVNALTLPPDSQGYDRSTRDGRKYKSCAVRDPEVARLRWIPYDCDPLRLGPSGEVLTGSVTSATDAEKAGAWQLASKVIDYWRALGYDPAVVDSANGFQVLIPADLPTTSSHHIEQLLKAHAAKWNIEGVANIDESVFNPSRVLALPGSWKKKGENSFERPWRMVRLLHAGSRNKVVQQ